MKLMRNFQCGKKKPKQIQIKNSLLKFKMTHYLLVLRYIVQVFYSMKNNYNSLEDLMGEIPLQVQLQTRMSVEIAARIEQLMREAGYSKKQFAEKLDRRPSEITKWLSGEHNFTIATLSRLSAFFGQPIIQVAKS